MSQISDKRCLEIADQVVPEFRVTDQRSCSSHAAKRWNAAYEAAVLARAEPNPVPPMPLKRYVDRADGRACEVVSSSDELVTFKWAGRDTLRYLGREEFDRRFKLPGSETIACCTPARQTHVRASILEEAAKIADEEAAMWGHTDGSSARVVAQRIRALASEGQAE